MPSVPHLRYSIYKISDLSQCRSLLLAKRYNKVNLDEKYKDWELYVSDARSNPPKWIPVLSQIVEDSKSLDHINDITYSFVLLITHKELSFAVCGGLGSFAIQLYVVDDFGLDVVSKVVESNKIKYKRSKNFTGTTAQEESLYKEYYNYEFDTSNWVKLTKEILGEIKNADLSEFFGLEIKSRHKIRLDGKNSLSINKAISTEDLKIVIEKLVGLEKKEPKFLILKGFQEVADKQTRDKLVKILCETLKKDYATFLKNPDDFQETNIGISYQDMKEFLLCENFKISLGQTIIEVQDNLDLIEIFKFLKSLNKEEFVGSYLRAITILGHDNDNVTKIDSLLKDFIYAEIKYQNKNYFFIDSHWFLINKDFQEEVDKQFFEILKISKISLPNYNLPSWKTINGSIETEDSYIKNACKEGSNFKQLHRKHIVITKGGDKCEICDIVDINKPTAFVYVKKGLGSNLRELLAQARSSAELFVRSPKFNKDSITEIDAICGKNKNNYDPKDIFWILAFTDHVLKRENLPLADRLGTIVKTDIMHTFNFLRELQLPHAGLYEIPHL